MATFIDEVGIRAVAFGLGDYRAGMTQIRREAFITGNAMVRFTGQSNAAGNAVTNLGAIVGGIGRNISTLGAQMSNLGIRMATFITAPILGASAAISRTAAGFESELTKIETLVGVNRDTVSGWRDEILRIAPALGALPSELAEGLFFITSAGVRDTTEAIEALEVAAKASAIGMGDLNEIARALAAGMNSFGISAEEAGEVLIATVRESQVEATELAPVLGRVLSFVEELGGSFEDAGAFIATFTRTGVTASVATTALRSTLTSLIKPTEGAKDALRQAGLSIEIMRDLIAEEGLAVALQILRRSLEEAGLELGDVITRSRGLVGALALTGEQADQYLQVSEKITGSTNQLDAAFERVTETTEFQWNRFVASINVAAQHIGEVLLPAINRIIDAIIPLIEGIAELARGRQDLVALGFAFAAIAAAVGPTLFLFGQLFSTIGTGLLFIGALITLFGGLLTPIGLVTAAIGTLGAAFAGLVTLFAITGRDIVRKADEQMGGLRGRMFRWGYEVIRAFSEGMIRALTLVVRALNSLSRVFADLLSPGSPPALLPDIDDWGKAAAQEWVDGWGKADFDVFGDIAQQVTGLLRGLGSAGDVEQQDIASAILGSREGIAQAINQFRETGTVTEEVLDRITRGLGDNQQVVQDYIVSMFRLEDANRAVEEAQDNLNDVQQHYNDLLDPLNRRLDQINEQQAKIRRQDERERLLAILEDPRATDEVRRRARLALEELNIRDQIARIESQRDEDVSAAEKELEIAKERAEAIEAQVEVQRELIELIKEQLDLISKAIPGDDAAAEEGAAGAGGGTGTDEDIGPPGGPGGFGDSFLDTLTKPFSRVRALFDEMRNKISGKGPGSIPAAIESLVGQLEEDLEPAIAGLNTELEEFSDIWAEVLVTWEGLGETKIGETLGTISSFIKKSETNQFIGTMADIFRDLGPVLSTVITGIVTFLALGSAAGISLGPLLTTVGAFLVAALLLEPVMSGLNRAIEVFGQTIDFAQEQWREMVKDIKSGDITTIPESVARLFLHLGALILSPVLFISGFIIGTFNYIADTVKKIVIDLFDELVGNSIIPEGIQDIADEFGKLRKVVDRVHEFLFGPDGLVSKFESLVKDLVGANGVVPNLINDIRGWFSGKLEDAIKFGDDVRDRIVSHFETLGSAIGAGIRDGIGFFFNEETEGQIANMIYQSLRAAAIRAVNFLEAGLSWLVDIVVNLPTSLFAGLGGDDDEPPEGATAPLRTGGVTTGIAPPVTSTTATRTAGGVTVIFEEGAVVINDDMDAKRFGGMVRREVSRAIRGI